MLLPAAAVRSGSSSPASGRPLAAVERFEFTQIHMGLPVRVVAYAAGRSAAEAAARAGFARIAHLDRLMSDYRPDSELRQLDQQAGAPVRVSPELLSVIRRALEIARQTNGAFDPTVGPLVALWREARAARRVPAAGDMLQARRAVGWQRLEIRDNDSSVRLPAGMRLDLGGIAKGYILQEAMQAMGRLGVTRALVEAGGDIVVGDPPPGRPGWRIQTPAVPPEFAQRASSMTNAALATSGPTAQFVEIDGVRYSHVVDPRTGAALTSDLIAHVIAADAATADALATALTVLGPEQAPAVMSQFPGTVFALSNAPRSPRPPAR